MATDEARYAGTESRPCTFATEDLLPDSRLHASLAYCALNGRTLPSTRINAVSPPSPSAAKRFRERGKAVCTNFNRSSSPLCLRLLFILPDSLSLYSCTGENLNFFFCSSFFPLQLLKQGPVSNCYCSFIRTNRGSGYDRYILYDSKRDSFIFDSFKLPCQFSHNSFLQFELHRTNKPESTFLLLFISIDSSRIFT